MALYSVNGEVFDINAPGLKPNDLGLIRGFGIFDFLRTKDGTPVFFQDYIERFFRSATKYGLHFDLDESQLRGQVDALLKRVNEPDVGIRLMLTGGYAEDGFTPTNSNFIIVVSPFAMPSVQQYAEGVGLSLLQFEREQPEIKSLNYAAAVGSYKLREKHQSLDVLYHSDGLITEVSRSNFYIISEQGNLVTADTKVLRGVTRKHLLAHCLGDVKLELRPIRVEELASAKEAFLTSSTKRVLPVTKIDGQNLGDGNVGPITKGLAERFLAHENAYLR